MKDSDYLKFVSDLEFYVSGVVQEQPSDKLYPVGKISDIEVYFQHYSDFEEAKNAWKKRCKRINRNNLAFLYVRLVDDEKDEFIQSFLKLPYKKAVLSLVKHPQSPDVYYMKGSDGIEIAKLNGLCGYRSKFSSKRYLDDFDFVSWLNKDG